MCRFAPPACATPLSQTFLLASGANVNNCGCQARWHACVFARSPTHFSALHSALVAIVFLHTRTSLRCTDASSQVFAVARISTIFFITRMVAILPARLLSVAGCRMGRHGAGEGRLPGSRPKGAHPRWVGGSWGSPSGVSRRLSEHGIAPSDDFATARDTWGLGRLAHRLWSAAGCALAPRQYMVWVSELRCDLTVHDPFVDVSSTAFVCSAIAACCAPARRARRSPGRGRRPCAIKQAARAATAGAKSSS